MTAQEIDALTPAELRVAVATTLGWQFIAPGDSVQNWIAHDPDGHSANVPNWPADIAAAWQLVESSPKEWEWNITWGRRWNYPVRVRIYKGEYFQDQVDSKVEVAICRAFLKAVMK